MFEKFLCKVVLCLEIMFTWSLMFQLENTSDEVMVLWLVTTPNISSPWPWGGAKQNLQHSFPLCLISSWWWSLQSVLGWGWTFPYLSPSSALLPLTTAVKYMKYMKYMKWSIMPPCNVLDSTDLWFRLYSVGFKGESSRQRFCFQSLFLTWLWASWIDLGQFI